MEILAQETYLTHLLHLLTQGRAVVALEVLVLLPQEQAAQAALAL
jgi:hypothetical protein